MNAGDRRPGPAPDDGQIVPATFTISARESSAERQGHRTSSLGIGIWIGLGILALLVAWVVFVLPDRVSDTAEQEAGDAGQAAVPAIAQGPERSPFAEAQLARQRQAAQEVLQGLLKAQEEVEAKAATQWAAEDYTRALDVATMGDTAYQQRDFELAQQHYRESTALFQELLDRGAQMLQDALAQGNGALAIGDKAVAVQAFDQALLLEPENVAAKAGRERAETIDQVFPLLKQGNGLLAAGQLNQAETVFSQAARLDPTAAQGSLNQVRARIADREFDTIMADANQALQAGQTDKARELYERAARAKPGAAEPKAAIERIAARAKDAQLAELLASAKAFEQAEQWPQAAEKYRAALAIDPANKDAQARAQHAQLLGDLQGPIAAILAQPDRIMDEAVYTEATKVRKQAQALPDKGPKLTAQVAELGRIIETARTPITVQLKSDRQTTITIFKIGNLGTFDTHELSLLPGKYTAVGSRDGYRDVRLEIVVRVDRPPEPIVIQCTERV